MMEPPVSRISYPMLRCYIEAFLEEWQAVTNDDIFELGDGRVKEVAEYLAELFAEVAKRIK